MLYRFLSLFVLCLAAEVQAAPPPFEKIYVKPGELLCTPYGTYYLSPSGKQEKVRTVLSDCCGCYVIKIQNPSFMPVPENEGNTFFFRLK